jgi:RimJ/RimL family protein N-acetyltransferase
VTPALPQVELRQGGLVLRGPTPEDAEALASAFADQALVEAADLPFTRPSTEEMRRAISELLPSVREAGLMAAFVVLDETDGALLGGAALHHVDVQEGHGEVGYWLLPEARGRGVATRTARIVSEWGFSLGLERIEAQTHLDNVPSQRVLERAGFRREGVRRSVHRQRGGHEDRVIFSLLRGE